MALAVITVAVPLATVGTAPRDDVIYGIWVFIAGIITAVLVAAFLKPGHAFQRK